jgi:hypothetical protein
MPHPVGCGIRRLGAGKTSPSNKIVTFSGNRECNLGGVTSVMMSDNNETGTGDPKPAGSC